MPELPPGLVAGQGPSARPDWGESRSVEEGRIDQLIQMAETVSSPTTQAGMIATKGPIRGVGSR